MKMIYTLAALVALSGAAMADDATCVTNWVNGACGIAKSDDSADKFKAPPAPVKEEPEEESAV